MVRNAGRLARRLLFVDRLGCRGGSLCLSKFMPFHCLCEIRMLEFAKTRRTREARFKIKNGTLKQDGLDSHLMAADNQRKIQHVTNSASVGQIDSGDSDVTLVD